jgi:hypothetical protein
MRGRRPTPAADHSSPAADHPPSAVQAPAPAPATDLSEPVPTGEPRDAGMSTAEYAIGTVAACGFAGVLWAVVHSSAVASMLQGIVERALSLGA